MSGPHAGFSRAEAWLPIGPDLRAANVSAQRDDPHSLLTLVRRLIEVRREHPVLVDGTHIAEASDNTSSDNTVLAYRRGDDDEASLFVALNLGAEPRSCALDVGAASILLSTYLDREGERCTDRLHLRADEGVIVKRELS